MSIFNYTLADFRSEVQLRLAEPSGGGLWSVADLNTYINRAVLRVAMDTRTVKQDASIPIINFISFYAQPDECMIPEFLYGSALWGNNRLFPTNLFALDRSQWGLNTWEKGPVGTPSNFIPFSFDKFILWPPPSVSTNINMHFVPFPATLSSDSSTTLFPLAAQRLVPIYASYLAQMKNNVERAFQHLSEYKARVPMAVAQQRHNAQLRPTIVAPGRTFDRKNASPEISRSLINRGYY